MSDDTILKKCLSLARALVRTGFDANDKGLLLSLLKRAYKYEAKTKGYRLVYDWLIKNKFDPDEAWQMSGLASVVAEKA